MGLSLCCSWVSFSLALWFNSWWLACLRSKVRSKIDPEIDYPKNMKNRDPPKPHILKESSSDMLAEPPIFTLVFHRSSMVFHIFSGTAPRPHLFSIFWKFYWTNPIIYPPLALSWDQNCPNWHPKSAKWPKLQGPQPERSGPNIYWFLMHLGSCEETKSINFYDAQGTPSLIFYRY